MTTLKSDHICAARRCAPALLLAGLLLCACAGRAAPPPPETRAPAIPPLVWAWPHDILWRAADGPTWASVGHSPTVLTIVPVGVKREAGEIIETRDGSGRLLAVELMAWAVTEIDAKTAAPRIVRPAVAAQAVRVGEPAPPERTLTPVRVRADDPDGGKQKRGLHRKRNGNWDFYFSALPKAPFTFHGRIFVRRSDQFRYCLVVHAEGDTEALPESLRAKNRSGKAFKDIRIHVLVSELLDDPTVEMRVSWPEGAPMPRRIQPSIAWYARQQVKARWVLTGPPVAADIGRLRVRPDGALTFEPARTNTVRLRADERRRREAEREAALPKIEVDDAAGPAEP